MYFHYMCITQEILQSENKNKRFSNITKAELSAVKSLSHDRNIIIKKADKSNAIVIMNSQDYVSEVLRQLDNKTYYTKLDSDPQCVHQAKYIRFTKRDGV